MRVEKNFAAAENNERVSRQWLGVPNPRRTEVAWVLTTAYYSALQYVQIGLFPADLEVPKGGAVQRFETFNQYFECVSDVSDHEATARLVDEYLPAIVLPYRDLMRMFLNSLEPSVTMGLKHATLAIQSLEEIRNFILHGQAVGDSRLVMDNSPSIDKAGKLSDSDSE